MLKFFEKKKKKPSYSFLIFKLNFVAILFWGDFPKCLLNLAYVLPTCMETTVF